MDYFLDMDEVFSREENAHYVLLPVPYDGTSTFIKGADKGPQAIIDASDSIELYDIPTEIEAYKSGIYTDKFSYDLSSPDAMVNSVYQRVKSFLQKKKMIGILGGEHSVSIGSICAVSEEYDNLSVLQIDAHADLRPEYHGSKYNHACVMRRAQEVADVVQVAIRNVCIEEKDAIKEENIFYAHKMRSNPHWKQDVMDRLHSNVYLTIDLDGLDPSILPATGTPLPGGMQWYELLDLLEILFQTKNVVAFDVVELCPQQESKTSDVLAAVLVYKIISFLEKKRLQL